MKDFKNTVRNVFSIPLLIAFLLLQQISPVLAKKSIPESLPAPVNMGWNVSSKSSIPNELPLDLACNELVYTNENSVAMNWSSVEGENIKYQREVTYPNGTISTDFYELNNYTQFVTFGGNPGTEGLWKTRVRAFIDANSNNKLNGGEVVSEWSNECQIRFDKTAPGKPVITKPTLDYINTAPILNEWSAITDESGIKQYQVEYIYDDGHSFYDMPYRYTPTNYRNHSPNINEQGGVTFRVRAIDNALNAGEWSEPKHYVYDATAPAKPTGLKRQTKDRTKDIACNSIVNLQTLIPDWDDNTDDPNFSHFEYTSFNVGGSIGINEQKLYSSEFVHNWLPTIEGTYGYAVRAVDLAGNKSDWAMFSETLEGSCKITYDSTPPLVSLSSPITPILSGSVDIIGSVTDANPHHYWLVIQKVGGGIVAGPGTVNDSNSFINKLFFTWDTTSVPDGEYIIKLEARDAANNKSNTDSVKWMYVKVDNTNPTVDLVFPIPGTGSTSFQAVFNESVNVAEAQNPANYYLHNWPTAGGSGDLAGKADIVYDFDSKTATISFLLPGWYISPEQEWGVQDIHDLAGNLQAINPYSETSTPMVAPITSDSGTDNVLHNTDVTVTLNCTDINGSGCWKTFYNINGGSFSEGNSILFDTDGEYTIHYYSVDRAGNIEAEKAAANIVKIDKTPPALNVTGATADGELMIGDILSGFELQTNNDPLKDYLLQFKFDTNASEPLEPGYFGLKLISSTITPDDLKSYYDLRGVPEPFLTYLKHAADGSNPFVYINTDTLKLVDATKHDLLGGSDIDMTVPGDFPLGTYTVEGKIFDLAGNETTVTLILKVLGDRVAPEVNVPANIEIEATSALGATVNYTAASAVDDVDGIVAVSCIPSSGSIFALGTTTITCNAFDIAGNEGVGFFEIKVVDTTAPVINQLADLQAGNAVGSMIVNYTLPSANDLVDGATTVNCSPSSGSTFPVGTTQVTCTSMDTRGNSSQMQFNVIVGAQAVAGTTTVRRSTQTTTTQNVVALGDEEATPTPTLTVTPTLETVETGAVLGLEDQACEQTFKASGDIYIDSNADSIKQTDEKGVSGIKLVVYTNDSSQNVAIKTLTTNELGNWTANLCPGDYKLKIDETTLPDGVKIDNNDISLVVTSEGDVRYDIPLLAINGSFNWLYLILLTAGAGFLLVIFKRK
jgi:hypothetical protein